MPNEPLEFYWLEIHDKRKRPVHTYDVQGYVTVSLFFFFFVNLHGQFPFSYLYVYPLYVLCFFIIKKTESEQPVRSVRQGTGPQVGLVILKKTDENRCLLIQNR